VSAPLLRWARSGDRRTTPDRRGALAEAEALRAAALTALRLGDAATAGRLVAESDLLDPPKVPEVCCEHA